jgi:hypothetical protein
VADWPPPRMEYPPQVRLRLYRYLTMVHPFCSLTVDRQVAVGNLAYVGFPRDIHGNSPE